VIIRSGVRLKDISAPTNADGSVIRGKVPAKVRGDWRKWLGECDWGRERGDLDLSHYVGSYGESVGLLVKGLRQGKRTAKRWATLPSRVSR